MGGTDMENGDAALRSRLRSRCAQEAMILYSLKSSPNCQFMTSSKNVDEEKDQMIKEIRDLKMKLARERVKRKRIKLCGIMEVILQECLVLFHCRFDACFRVYNELLISALELVLVERRTNYLDLILELLARLLGKDSCLKHQISLVQKLLTINARLN